MGMIKYSIPDMCYELDVPNTTIQEVKNKLRIKGNANEEGFKKIKRFIEDVRRCEGKTSLSAINDFLDTHKLEDYR